MKIRMLKVACGPKLNATPGDVLDVSDEIGAGLIADDAARLVEPTEAKRGRATAPPAPPPDDAGDDDSGDGGDGGDSEGDEAATDEERETATDRPARGAGKKKGRR